MMPWELRKRRNKNTEFLHNIIVERNPHDFYVLEVEYIIRSFIEECSKFNYSNKNLNERPSLTLITPKTSFHRKIIHALCEFYKLSSESTPVVEYVTFEVELDPINDESKTSITNKRTENKTKSFKNVKIYFDFKNKNFIYRNLDNFNFFEFWCEVHHKTLKHKGHV
jgi:hypothetical protein